MNSFTFNGDWAFKLELSIFSKFQLKKAFSFQNLNFSSGTNVVVINDFRDYNPEPLVEQINAINYLIKNEREILQSLKDYLYNVINVYYAEACGYWEWIPQIDKVEELGKLIEIIDIRILFGNKDDFSFIEINCEYIGDEEHGLVVIFHKNEMLEYSGIGGMLYDSIEKDQNSGVKVTQYKYNWEFGTNMIHKRLKKYNKFKPWQLEATLEYIELLVKSGENKKLLEELKLNNWDINFRFPEENKNLLDIACNLNNIELVAHLLNKGANLEYAILENIGYNYNEDILKLLVQNGANIDTLVNSDITHLCREIEKVKQYNSQIEDEFYSNSQKKEANKKKKESKRRILFFLSLGANLGNCKETNIEKLKEILKNKSKPKIWQFWKKIKKFQI